MGKISAVLSVLLAFAVAVPAFALDPARGFLPAGKFAIDWDIGFSIPPGWPPFPISGGPGLRFSPTDNIGIGFQIHIPPFFQGAFQSDLFFAWRFWKPENIPLQLSGTAESRFSILSSSIFRLEPSAGLCLEFGTDAVSGYLAADFTLWIIPNAPVAPLIETTIRLGVVLPAIQYLTLELSLIDFGRYSSISRTWLGRPMVSIGMINSF
jgi:hypothetical protein